MPQKLNDLERELLRSRSERKVFPFRHSPYDCSQKDIDDYTIRYQPRKVRHMQLWEANHEIAVFLNPSSTPSPEVLAALHRLKVAKWTEPWSPDVIIKAVHDTDTAFFYGRLRRRVAVSWSKIETINSMKKKSPNYDWPIVFGVAFGGDTDAPPHPGTSRVCLNSDAMFDAPDPKEEMWQTTVHELVHAYLQITCGRLRAHPLDVPGGYPIGHGYLGKPMEDVLYRYGPRTMDSLPSFVTNVLQRTFVANDTILGTGIENGGSLFDIELLEEKRADAGKATESEATNAESTEKSTELTMKDTDAKDKGTKPEGKHAERKTMGREPKDKAPVDAGSKVKKFKRLKDKSTKSSGKTADGPKTKAYSSSE